MTKLGTVVHNPVPQASADFAPPSPCRTKSLPVLCDGAFDLVRYLLPGTCHLSLTKRYPLHVGCYLALTADRLPRTPSYLERRLDACPPTLRYFENGV